MGALKNYPFKRTVIKTVILVIVLMLISYLVNHPVLNNELAMSQMQNSNELYILWETYNSMRNMLPAVYSIIGIVYLVGIGADINRFIKNKQKEGN